MTMQAAPQARDIPKSPTKRKIAGSAAMVMGVTALSAVLGFGREIICAHFYGTRSEMDAFLNASTIPATLFGVFNGALMAALGPTFNELLSEGRPDEARRLGSTVVNGLIIGLSLLTIVGWYLAPYFVPIVAHGFSRSEQSSVIKMVRWLMPGIIASSISGVFASLLNAHHRFLSSSMIWVAANVVTITFILALHKNIGIFALVLGSVFGLFAQLAVQLPSILRLGLYRFELDLQHPGLARIWPLLIPVAIGSSGSQINLAFDRFFASTLATGSTAAMSYTSRLAFLPIPIVAGAISTVTFPIIAQYFATSNKRGIRDNVALALRLVGFIVIPGAFGLCALAYPIVETLFQRGAFGPPATALCATLIPFACVALVATSFSTVLSRACYACKEVRLAVIGSLLTVLINIVLSASLLRLLGARGLLLSNGIAGFFSMGFLLWIMIRLVGGLDWKPLLSALSRIMVASLAMTCALFTVRAVWNVHAIALGPRALYLVALVTIGGAIYVGVAHAIGIEELTTLTAIVKQKLSRRPAPGLPI